MLHGVRVEHVKRVEELQKSHEAIFVHSFYSSYFHDRYLDGIISSARIVHKPWNGERGRFFRLFHKSALVKRAERCYNCFASGQGESPYRQ